MRARATMAAAAITVVAAAGLASEARADWRVGGGVVIRTDRDFRGYDGRGDDRYGRQQGPAFRYGFDRGWREGSEEGHSDGRRSRDPRYWREGEFRHADRGYRGWMGPRWDYSNGFREGYRAGYRRAYASVRPRWRGSWERYGWGSSGDSPYGDRDRESYRPR
jgi:hypothetical protein